FFTLYLIFLNATATTEIYTLSLHDALPILKFPEDGKVVIRSLAEQDASRLPHFHGIIKDVEILGFEEQPNWTRTQHGLEITTTKVQSNKPVVYKIHID